MLAHAPARRGPLSAAAGQAGAPGEQPTILVVDDEPLARQTLTDLLEAHGYRVIGAADAEEAFDLLHEADLILLDAMLPGTDGWTICREIKERIDPLLPIIMVTARTAPEDVVRTFDAGADDYIPKPFQVAELQARIDSRLRAHRAEQALQEANRQASQLAEQNYRLYEQARRDAEERADLLRELDHRVRNNLGVIMGLVSMERTRGAARPAGEALLSLENRLRAFLMAYEAFRRSNYRGVPLREIADRILQRLKNTLRPESRISTTVTGDDALVSERYGFSLALAINELASSAIRHGFPNGREGQLASSVLVEATRIEIVIADDGVPADARGAEVRDEVLGEQSVVRALIENELGGRVTVDPTAQGTRIRVSCPVRPEPPTPAESEDSDRAQ
ncbi:MAG TPA: response regulator [Longimicrobiales bacterium]|nr:response regulator [Longimicrobiales bacterium]